ncbi:hypothetical protein D3C87_657410 [compost metagenome]
MPAPKQKKMIFQLSKATKQRRFNSILAEVLERNASLGQPQVFRSREYTEPALFIHSYPNGRQVLIEVNTENSEEKAIKVLV